MKQVLWLILIATQALIASCTPHPLPDPLTVRHLEDVKVLPSDSLSACDEFVAYEEGKKASGSELYDEKSLRNVNNACDCMRGAVGGDSVMVRACLTSIDGYLIYEHAKE
jgi:hypothetical protein